ncbi:MAG: rod shape-determining protein MreD [Lachnospiraceae bacterium]|nr:rod shape-determining protein MreD [Lachnospiraceae bacterium]
MKRIITLGILIIFCYVLQVGVFSYFKMAGIIPNIMLILVVSFAIMRGQVEGMLVGFFCGLLIDVMAGDAVGLYALLYLFIGYVNGYFHLLFYANNILLPLGMILGNSVVYNLIVYVFSFLLRNKTDFGFYFMHVMMPEVVYTFLVAIFLYNVLLWINRFLEQLEKRSAA